MDSKGEAEILVKSVVKNERRRIKDAVESSTLPNKKDVLDVIFPSTGVVSGPLEKWMDLSK